MTPEAYQRLVIAKFAVHFRCEGSFICFCGVGMSEVEHWTYYNIKELDGVSGRRICPECEDWANLHVLAQAKL